MYFDVCVSITMPLLLFLFTVYVARQLFWEPYLRRQWSIIITPFFIGLTVSSIMRQSPYLITGLLFSGLIYSWLAIFRFPPSFRTAQKQLKAGQFEEALSSLSQAIQQDATLSELYRMRSLLNLSQKYYLHAERDAKKAIELNPKFSINLSTLGQIYWSQADFKQAHEIYQKAYQLAPRLTLHQINLGIVLYMLKEYVESEKLLRKAVKNKKISKQESLWVTYYLGRNQEFLGNQKQAQKTFRKMKRFRKALNEIKNNFGSLSPALKESLQIELDELEVRLNS